MAGPPLHLQDTVDLTLYTPVKHTLHILSSFLLLLCIHDTIHPPYCITKTYTDIYHMVHSQQTIPIHDLA